MDVLEMTVTQFIDGITQDIKNVREKGWLKTAIVSHCGLQFPAVKRQQISDIVSAWYKS